ncbi:ketoacyl-ACP synthase III [soil metagenome]
MLPASHSDRRKVERHVGIVGIGTYLPPEIRTNAWWPAAIVDGWMAQRRQPAPLPHANPSEGMRRVMAAMAQQAVDPFQGMTHRHVLAEDMTSVDMEAEAARRALAHAGIDRSEVDLGLSHTPVPEFLLSNSSCVLHETLGLRPECMTLQVDAAGNSFLMQLTIAEQMIASGRASCALIVQSAAGSRLVEVEEPQSPLFGDGAAAMVLAPTERPSFLSTVHRTDGKHPRALIASVRGKRWYDDGRVVLHRGDLASARQSFLETADRAVEVIGPALAKAGVSPADIDLFAAHQGTPWLREVTMEIAGMTRARHHDSFATTGYLFGASIPFVLQAAHQAQLVEEGQLVLILGGGVGATIGAIVMRWGRLAR